MYHICLYMYVSHHTETACLLQMYHYLVSLLPTFPAWYSVQDVLNLTPQLNEHIIITNYNHRTVLVNCNLDAGNRLHPSWYYSLYRCDVSSVFAKNLCRLPVKKRVTQGEKKKNRWRRTKHLLVLLKVNISHKALRWISCNYQLL